MHKLMIIGEAFNPEEEEKGRPFAGASGYMLTQILSMFGIDRDQAYLTNCFNFRPAGNDIQSLCGPKAEAITGFPPLSQGKHIHAKHAHELVRLEQEIRTVRPNLILALGGTAAWFTLHDGRISKIRGATNWSRFGIKVLPTYHPAAVLRDYSLRPILTADISKAAKEMEFPELKRPARFIHIEPSVQDIRNFYLRYIAPSETLSTDVETIGNQITCIGFAPSSERAIVIPFYAPDKPGNNYWPTLEEELAAWRWVRRIMAEGKKNIGQNFIYDAKFFWRSYGMTVPGMEGGDDTMLLHHALQPEMQKGLAFLGSIYTDEAPWKLERKGETVKKED